MLWPAEPSSCPIVYFLFDIRKSTWVKVFWFLAGKSFMQNYFAHISEKHSWNECGNLLVWANSFCCIRESTMQRESISKQYNRTPSLFLKVRIYTWEMDMTQVAKYGKGARSWTLFYCSDTQRKDSTAVLCIPKPNLSAFKSIGKVGRFWVLTSYFEYCPMMADIFIKVLTSWSVRKDIFMKT